MHYCTLSHSSHDVLFAKGVNMVRIIPQNAVAFYCKDYYKKLIGGDKPTALQLMAASCLSGCTCITAIYPLDIAVGFIFHDSI